ncbi:MAG: OmpA family protein [Lacisediminimonas sp.]|nr:OmpA family protein [Lacisediminimonas sp.]
MICSVKTSFLAAVLVLITLLAGCASSSTGSYVVLLRDPDGKLGNVVVKNPQGEQVLSQAFKAATLDGSKAPYFVMQDQLQRDFGAALAARPELPETFTLNFETGGAELTAPSKALLPKILERARARTALDLSVIGHSDTVGKADANEALALKRANAIAQQLRQLGLQNATLTVESHGERNLLEPTPDETPEPRNRRVEITLR